MGGGVDGPELGDRDPRVEGGGLQLGVAEHLRDVADVGPALEHERGGGVAEQVAAAALSRCARRDVGLGRPRQPVRADRLSRGREEQDVSLFDHELGTHQVRVSRHPQQGPGTDGDVAAPSALALADEHGPPGGVDADASLGEEPGKGGLDRDDALGLGAKRQRRAVGLLVVEQMALVGLEGCEADNGRLGDVEGAEELDQVSEVVGPAGDGRLDVAVAGQPAQVLLGRQRERGVTAGLPRVSPDPHLRLRIRARCQTRGSRPRGVARCARRRVGEQVAVLAARAAGYGDEVLKGDQAGQTDADLVLEPAEQLAQLPAGEGDRLGGDTLRHGALGHMGLKGDEEAPGLGGQVVGASGEDPLGQTHAQGGDVSRGFHVADATSFDLDAAHSPLVLGRRSRRR